MNAKRAFLLELAAYLQSNKASSYFINGIPGSGNADLLEYLLERLPTEMRRTAVFGIYKPDVTSLRSYLTELGGALMDAGMLTHPLPPDHQDDSLDLFWQRVREQHCVPHNQCLVIMIEMNGEAALTEVGQFFSALRALATSHKMTDVGFQLHHIVTGCWQHVELDRHYRDNTAISFPYTVGVNYRQWTGLGNQEVIELLPDQPYHALRGQLLYEIADGHAATISEIIANLPNQEASMRNVLEAVQRISAHGESCKQFLSFWQQLPAFLFHKVRLLLQYQRLPYGNAPHEWDMLHEAGIVRFFGQPPDRTVRVRCWFVELLLRSHWSQLTSVPPLETTVEDVIPQLQTFNLAAYEIIHEMETVSRNLAALLLTQIDGNISLENRVIKPNQQGENEDLRQRALASKRNATRTTNETIPHPLTAYSQLRDLGALFDELGDEIRDDRVKAVGTLIVELSTVRNQVMHNQIIGDDTLDSLEKLRKKVYERTAELAFS